MIRGNKLGNIVKISLMLIILIISLPLIFAENPTTVIPKLPEDPKSGANDNDFVNGSTAPDMPDGREAIEKLPEAESFELPSKEEYVREEIFQETIVSKKTRAIQISVIIGVIFLIYFLIFLFKKPKMPKKYCSGCGSSFKPEDTFCSICGKKIK